MTCRLEYSNPLMSPFRNKQFRYDDGSFLEKYTRNPGAGYLLSIKASRGLHARRNGYLSEVKRFCSLFRPLAFKNNIDEAKYVIRGDFTSTATPKCRLSSDSNEKWVYIPGGMTACEDAIFSKQYGHGARDKSVRRLAMSVKTVILA